MKFSELKNSTIYSDKAYDGLMDYDLKLIIELNVLQNEIGRNHINGIDSFPAFVKHRLSKFKRIKRDNCCT